MDPTNRLAAEIARRRLVIPFAHGSGVTGILVADWRPRKRFSGQPPTLVKHGTLYCVLDGAPFALLVPVTPCRELASLDVDALYERAASLRLPLDRPVKGSPETAGETTHEPFRDLAWGAPFTLRRPHHLSMEAVKFLGIRFSEIYPAADRAAPLVTASLAAASGHFQGRLDTRAREVFEFMRAGLPHFTWGAFRALLDDVGGGVRAFAEAYPLLAGRALACPKVAKAASSGDLEGAFGLSLRPDLIGRWACPTFLIHPGLARLPAGGLRGRPLDKAVETAVHLDRNHVPRDEAGLAAFVEVSDWIESVRGIDRDSAKDLVRGLKGHWSKARDACRDAAMRGGRRLNLFEVRDAVAAMSYNFGNDFIESSARLVQGDGALPDSFMNWFASSSVRSALPTLGMNLPDRVRHAVRYLDSRAEIAGSVYRVQESVWHFPNVVPDDMPWVTVDETLDVKPLYLGSPWLLAAFLKERVGPDRRFVRETYLPASTPCGRVVLACLCRGANALAMRDGALLQGPDRILAHIGPALAAHYGWRGGIPGLGNAMLAHHGALERLSALARSDVEKIPDRITAMRNSWGLALPRRYRHLDAHAFAAAMMSEFEALLSRIPDTEKPIPV